MKKILLLVFVIFLSAGTAAAGPFDLVARQGMRGDEVGRVQMLLIQLGYYIGPLDSVFGQATHDAVLRAQKSVGLPEDGVVTRKMLRLLDKQSKAAADNPSFKHARALEMEATAYTSEDPGCGLYTARGNRLRKGLVAVDPRVIPLGTRLFVAGYGYAIADDTGGDIQGNRIDLAYEKRADAFKFGRRMLTVYILE
jgi:3D (Asp-Asp-Asp) domain-containing protein